MNTLLLIFSGLVFTGLWITITLVYGTQKSISDSYYRFNKFGKALFTLIIWAFTIPLILISDSMLFMIAGGFLCLVGAAANFKFNSMELKAHMLGAFTGIVLAFIALWIDFNLWYIFVAFTGIATLLYYFKDVVVKFIWWLEIAAFYLIMIGLTINLYGLAT